MATPFECLRRFNVSRFCGFAVSRYAVSMASPFLASLFLWLRRLNGYAVSSFYVLRTFEWLRRFSLRRF
ncbi:MAG: hypothetical protein II037_12350 [Bacteroidales bacterium]|nr:hypothetical protein [Bacteroidales bacterium]